MTKVIGLTGSIGMGKTTVAGMFADAGIAVFDADAAVHRLQGPAGTLVPAIEKAFPNTTSAQGVDRIKLAERVLSEPAALRRLEALVHPAFSVEREAFLAAHAADEMVLLDIPLLFETGGTESVDVVVVVTAPATVQRARVLARPNMTPEKLGHILARQWPDAEKRARADWIIDTGGTLAGTREQVRAIIACLTPKRDS